MRHAVNLVSLLLLCVFSIAPSPALAQLDSLCRREAERYETFLTHRRKATPERVADVYVITFTTKGADMHAQEVWRRMQAQKTSVEAAIAAHLERIAADWPSDEMSIIRGTLEQELRDMERIRQLVVSFEAAALTPTDASAMLERGWRAQRWSLPNPIEHYVAMIPKLAATYRAEGADMAQATLRAAVDTRAAVEAARGVPRSAIIGPQHPCYLGDLHRFEVAMRHAALIADHGPATGADVGAAAKRMGLKPEQMSPLSYYTHFKFGPRDYSLDRFSAWALAATNGSGRGGGVR